MTNPPAKYPPATPVVLFIVIPLIFGCALTVWGATGHRSAVYVPLGLVIVLTAGFCLTYLFMLLRRNVATHDRPSHRAGYGADMAQRAIPEPKKIRWKRTALWLPIFFLFGTMTGRLRHHTWVYSAERAALVTLALLLLFALMAVGARLGLRRLRRLQEEGEAP